MSTYRQPPAASSSGRTASFGLVNARSNRAVASILFLAFLFIATPSFASYDSEGNWHSYDGSDDYHGYDYGSAYNAQQQQNARDQSYQDQIRRDEQPVYQTPAQVFTAQYGDCYACGQ